MGRTPEYKAAFMASLGANPEFYAPFGDNALNWYKKFASRALFLNHVLVDPPVDRKKPIHEVADVFIHVVKERDDGIIVSGAKMLATGSAITHATFVAQNSSVNLEKGKAEDFAWSSSRIWTRGAPNSSAATRTRTRRSAPSTTPCRAVSTKTTRCCSSIMPSYRGRTSSSTAMSRRPTPLPCLRLLQPLQPAIRQRLGVKLDFMAVCSPRASRPTARTTFVACRWHSVR